MKSVIIKAEKGVIELVLEIIDNKLSNVTITGDFFFHPEDALEELENTLNNSKADLTIIKEKIVNLYAEKKISTPGITLENWLEVFKKAIES
jgi:hypothetical protein